jgi:hypothetical protein
MLSLARYGPLLAGCLILLQGADFLLTWVLLGVSARPDVYEANPLANAVLARHGWVGVAAFKALCGAVALGAVVLAGRRSPALAARLLTAQCMIMAGVVGYSAALVARPDGGDGHRLAALEAAVARTDGKFAALERFAAERAEICRALLAGEHTFATAIERMGACLDRHGHLLTPLHRSRLPDVNRPSQVAAYLYHYCSRVLDGAPQQGYSLQRVGEELRRQYPGAPRRRGMLPPQGKVSIWASAAG